MPGRGWPLATAANTTVSAHWTRQAPAACLAKRPVSMAKVLPPISFSTRTFKLATYGCGSRLWAGASCPEHTLLAGAVQSRRDSYGPRADPRARRNNDVGRPERDAAGAAAEGDWSRK